MLQVPDLPAQRWLRGVEPSLSRLRHAAHFGDGDEIPKMSQLHCARMPVRHVLSLQSLFRACQESLALKPQPALCRPSRHRAGAARVGYPYAVSHTSQELITMDKPVILITGALTGIGRATAVAFSKKGASVVVAGRRDKAGK